jgi:hypothetical protein
MGCDLFGCLRVVAMFALLLLAPGYLLGRAANLAGFRRMDAAGRLGWSVALSFAVMPIAAAMLGKYAGLGVVCGLGVACGAAAFGFLAWDWWRTPTHPSQARRWAPKPAAIAIAAAWVAFVLVELVDVGVGNRLFLSLTVYDHALRTAFVQAVMRTGVPPLNPLYWPGGHGAPMRYYYFWYVLTAAATRLAGASARQGMIASVVWGGFGLAAVVGLYCRHFLGRDDRPFRLRRFAAALGLLMVTGLDVVPAVVKALARMPSDADMEWWSQAQVTSWMDSLLWVPHHIAGLVCCLVGFLLAWMVGAAEPPYGLEKSARWPKRATYAVVAGLAFASAFGLSIWIAVASAMVMAAWVVWVLGWERKNWARGRVGVLLAAGVVAVVVLAPYLRELRGEASGTEATVGSGASSSAGANHLLRVEVRHMVDPGVMLAVPGFAELKRAHPRLEDAVAGLLLLAPGYITELGFYGLVLFVALRAAGRSALGEAERSALVLTLAGLAVATFLRSAVVGNNDFGMRAILIPQFFLLLLAVRWYEGGMGESSSRGSAAPGVWMRRVRLATLCLGVAGTVYQATMLRVYLPMEERLCTPDMAGLAERAMAWRTGFREMDRKIAKDAVIQFNTQQPSEYFSYAQILQAQRQIAGALPVCAAVFGGDPSGCAAVQNGTGRLFATGGTAAGGFVAPTAEDARAECGQLGIDDLVATRWDAVWRDRASWVWGLPAVVDIGDVRVLDCGRAERAAAR